jgi:glycerol 2-dehydrogenase (NADP+)
MTREGGPDFSHDWLDTWKEMEKVYKANPDKVKAIGAVFPVQSPVQVI